MNTSTNFFLGANSNIGFVSYFKQLREQYGSLQLFILKGGPGSGKSSLMKKVSSYALSLGHNVELIPCASDTSSLDGFIDTDASFAMIDGTAPHTEDPSLPGALHHIIYTGDFWNTKFLSEKQAQIKFLSTKISDLHLGAGAYIKAASALLEENLRISEKYADKKRAADLSEEICNLLSKGTSPGEETRLLSAVTVGEIKYFQNTVNSFADKIYVLADPWGGFSDILFGYVRSHAAFLSVKRIHCPCSVLPKKTDHMLFPDARTGIVTENSFLPSSFKNAVRAENLYYEIPNLSFLEENEKVAATLLKKASFLVKEAKSLHDELEHIYVSAMDFSKMDALFEKIIRRFYM